MECLQLQLLGGVEVRQGGCLVSEQLSRKAQALLCYLAVTARPHSREALAGLLWSDFPEKRARANLRDTLSGLRKHLPFNLIINRQNVGIRDDPALSWIDVAEFQLQVQQALHAPRHGTFPSLLPAETIDQLEQTMALYKGDFLNGFYLRRAVVFEEWVAAQREYLRQLAVEALQTLVKSYTVRGNYPAGLAHARRLLDLDPWREEVHRQMMLLLALSGQPSAALKQYETCRQIIVEELGVWPATETTTLYDRIQRGDFLRDSISAHGYELLELVGEGASGKVVVFRAYQPALKREVAIKFVSPAVAGNEALIDRLEAEAEMVACLEIPWIVPLYDYWREPGGIYLVLRFMRGGSLTQSLTKGAWPLEAAVRFLDQLSSALAVVHEKGIVHRDLKPGNILLDELGNAYIGDFGIAQELNGRWPHDISRVFYGTPAYMSPEQVRREPATPHSDIYSLGLVLYELLCGHHIFDGNSDAELYRRHLNDPTPSLLDVRDDLPPSVDKVIQRATAKNPNERYPEVRALASAFRRAVFG